MTLTLVALLALLLSYRGLRGALRWPEPEDLREADRRGGAG